MKKDGRLFGDKDRIFSEILFGLKRAKEIGKIPFSTGIDTWGVDNALLDENDSIIDGVYNNLAEYYAKSLNDLENIHQARNIVKKSFDIVKV